MITEEVQTSTITANEVSCRIPADHSFQRGYDWSRDGSSPRVKIVNTFYSTLIVPRISET